MTLARYLHSQLEPPVADAVHVQVAVDPAVGTVTVLLLENLEEWDNLRKLCCKFTVVLRNLTSSGDSAWFGYRSVIIQSQCL